MTSDFLACPATYAPHQTNAPSPHPQDAADSRILKNIHRVETTRPPSSRARQNFGSSCFSFFLKIVSFCGELRLTPLAWQGRQMYSPWRVLWVAFLSTDSPHESDRDQLPINPQRLLNHNPPSWAVHSRTTSANTNLLFKRILDKKPVDLHAAVHIFRQQHGCAG
jgi:hypothetical protein